MSKQEVQINSDEFQPLNEFLLVRVEKSPTEKKTASGLIVPVMEKRAWQRPTSGEVVGVGKDIADVKVGDFVVWPETDGIDAEFLDGDGFTILRYKSLIGIKKNA